MAIYKIAYPGLSESLKHFRIQVIDSLPSAVRNLPRFNTPEQIFNYCKSKFIFKSDPHGVELFQTVPTLLTANKHGRPGEGDCDDATIFCLTMLLISGFRDCGVVLAGRNDINATHIYAYVNDNGQKKLLDLTTNKFNKEGGQANYTYRQFIPFKISKTQLDMFLQLADGNSRKRTPRRRKVVKVSNKHGVYMPSKNVFIPIEKFDKMPIPQATNVLLSEGYHIEQLSEYLSGRAERKKKKAFRQYKKEKKFETKQEKKGAKTEVIKGRAAKKQASAKKKISKGKAAETRSIAKKIKFEKGGGGQGMKVFDKIGNVAKNIFSPGQEEEEEDYNFNPDQEETNFDFNQPDQETDETNEPEEVEAEEVENNEEELSESMFTMQDVINTALFAVGVFLEKTKRVA